MLAGEVFLKRPHHSLLLKSRLSGTNPALPQTLAIPQAQSPLCAFAGTNPAISGW